MDFIRNGINRAKLTNAFYMYKVLSQGRHYRRWLRTGRPVPPPHIYKQDTIKKYAKEYNTQVFVETGTYLGEMVNAMRTVFTEIYSVELGEKLARRASKRFALEKHVTILQGNSSNVLMDLLPKITRPSLFWLDAHYSGGATAIGEIATPLEDELSSILAHPLALKHVILIDDARNLGKEVGYPTLESLQRLVHSSGLRICEVKNDIVRIHN